MPPVIAAVIAYVAANIVSILVKVVIMIALAAASYLLTPKPKGISPINQDRLVSVRDPIRPREIVYGTVRKGGTYVFIGSSSTTVGQPGKEILWLVIALAGHECAGIDEIYFNDDLAFNAAGVLQHKFKVFWNGAWYDKAVVIKHLGGSNQLADPVLQAYFPGTWTANHRLRGICYLVVALWYTPDLFRSVPNITVMVRGKSVYDPRTATTAYSENISLQIADYLHDPTYGLGAAYGTEIATAEHIAAANICDEVVAIPNSTEKRYTGHAILSSGETPQSNLEMLLSGMAGRLPYSGGQWILHAGAWEAPVLTLTEDDLRGNLQVQTRLPRRDLCNAVRGLFVSAAHGWQPADFPPVVSTVFQAQDNGETIWRDVELPCTVSATMAQRLARIELYATREQLGVVVPCSLRALQVRAGDVIALTNTRMGWTAKPFLITDWRFSGTQDGQGATALGCVLDLREISEAVYDISADDYALLASQPASTLPDAFAVGMPGAPTITEELYVTRDGSAVKLLVRLVWTASADAFVIEGGMYQVEYARNAPAPPDTEFHVAGRTPTATMDLLDFTPGYYTFRVKAINSVGIHSAYAWTSQEVYGLQTPPTAPTDVTISAIGGMAVLRWAQHVELDVRIGGHILFRHAQVMTGATWEQSVTIGEAVAGNNTLAILPLKPGSYLVKARDSVGNLSVAAAVAVTDGATILAYTSLDILSEHPTFSGSHSGTEVVSNALQLSLTGDVDDWADVDAVTNWDAEGGYGPAGTYTFASGFDFTTKTRVRLRTLLDVLIVNTLDLFDERGASIDDWTDFDGTVGAEADVQIWARWTDDDPAGSPTWSDWHRIDSAEYHCRALQFEARLSSADSAYNIQVSELTIDADVLV